MSQTNNDEQVVESKKSKKKIAVSIPVSTAISSAAVVLTGTVNGIYSKHRMNEIKSEWSTSAIDPKKAECSQRVLDSLSDEELVKLLQENGLLNEDNSVDVKTI